MLTKDELQDIVEELKQHRGKHTELITVLIAAGKFADSPIPKENRASTNEKTLLATA